jgi:hypothetical protein
MGNYARLYIHIMHVCITRMRFAQILFSGKHNARLQSGQSVPANLAHEKPQEWRLPGAHRLQIGPAA